MRLRTVGAAAVGAVAGFVISRVVWGRDLSLEQQKRIYANKINEKRQAYIVDPDDIITEREHLEELRRHRQRSMATDPDDLWGDCDE